MGLAQDDPPTETQTTVADASVWEWITEQRAARWLVVLVGLTFGFVSLTGGWWGSVCSQELAAVGAEPVVRICRTPSVTDPAFIIGSLLLLFLLWPDVSKISIGNIALEKQIAKSKEETEKLITALRFDLKMQQQMNIDIRFPEPRANLPVEEIERIASVGVERVLEAIDDPEADFVQRWSTIEAVLDWVDTLSSGAARYKAALFAGGPWRTGPTPLMEQRPELITEGELADLLMPDPQLLGYSIPSEQLFPTLRVVQKLLDSYSAELDASRSARNLLTHSELQIEDSLLRSLAGRLGELEDALHRRLDKLATPS